MNYKHQDLYEFCYRFAHNCQMIATGNYVSDNGKYTIEYVPKILSAGEPKEELNTSCRVYKDDGLCQVSENKMKDKSEAYVLFAIISCFCMDYVNNDTEDHSEADTNALEIMSLNGYKIEDKEELISEVAQLFGGNPSQMNVDRLKTISEYIRKYKM